MSSNLIIGVCTAYVVLLFGVAFLADRRARRGRLDWLQSPLVYTLSISVYCTGWTFYGAVGSAARSGLEFVAIYTGPVIVFIGWWWFLRKLVRIGRLQRITSIADLVSSRYGKSNTLAVLVTVLAVVASTPYIALQLQSLTLSFTVFAPAREGIPPDGAGFWIAAGLALFTILFGTRNVDANERHHGVVTAIALEAVIKLVALVAVGLFVVFGLGGGPGEVFADMPPALTAPEGFGARWLTITFLSGAAVVCLPRMFQVTVVENVDERHLATAAWAFPLYLLLICLFVLPIAVTGLRLLPPGANPDMFVLTLPLMAGQDVLALVALIGGFSSATSMVIVATIALSTMVSNHIIMPIWLRLTLRETKTSGDVRSMLLISRRASIIVLLLLGYLYFRLSGSSTALASIGLIAFAGVAQILPSLVAGVFWRGATRRAALAATACGFAIWVYTLLLPSFEAGLGAPGLLANGPWGIAALRPHALFGLEGVDPLSHALFWSMSVNVAVLVGVSLVTLPSPLERLQAALFVDVFRMQTAAPGAYIRRYATSEDLFTLAQRILGTEPAHRLFTELARDQGLSSGLPRPDDALIERLERELAGAVGAASAHAMVGQIASGETISMGALISIADETAQIVEYSHRLEEKSRELEETAAELRLANMRLQELGAQRDAFLAQVSHELRTPMTSIRSFSDILRENRDLPPEQARRFLGIISDESQRLTRLLDEILDLGFLESRRVAWELEQVDLEDVLDRALSATEALTARSGLRITRSARQRDAQVMAQRDRLAQVFINLISNAVKYAGPDAALTLTIRAERGGITVDVADDGPGVPDSDREQIFEKFARARGLYDSRGAGLGLPISREIMRNFGGDLTLRASRRGAIFRVYLPRPGTEAAQRAAAAPGSGSTAGAATGAMPPRAAAADDSAPGLG
ncbi:ATP-binding protein [Oceanicella sp. SM1341]|uniref:ATP-binding protein n=1 Tax=Oceanicella sp. SM1341 TaxID=1548889 RepID=UPI0018E52908